MSTDTNTLGLFIPQQTIEFPDMPYLKPRDAEKWIANLPTAHVGESARLIYKAIAAINRTPLPVQQRFKLLEIFREPFEYVVQSLQKRHINQAFPLSDKNLKIAELARELQWELAIGYKIIIEASFSHKSGRVSNKLLLTCIYRTLCCLGESLLSAYLTYSPPQASQTWQEINHLYLFSERNRLVNEKVKDEVIKIQNNRSIGSIFKHIILLSLSNPYRLSQSEILRVNQALPAWTDLSHLHLFNAIVTPQGIFAIDLDNDAAPNYYNTSQKSIDTDYVRIFDTSDITKTLQGMHDEANNESQNSIYDVGNGADELHKETLHRLILAWGSTPKRSATRKGKDKEETIQITTGLLSTHWYIQRLYESEQSDSQILEPKFPASAEYNSDSVTGTCDPGEKPDVWGIVPMKSDEDAHNSTLNSNTQAEKPQIIPAATEESHEIHSCQLINESASGYCVRWGNNSKTKTIVGSLVGVSSKKDDWNIGVIRWLKSPEKTPMYLGIELLSPTAYAIGSRSLSRRGDNGEYTRSLLLPERQSSKQPQTLVTQFLYKSGDRLELDIHGQLINVKLTKLLESSNAFNQFEFSIIKTEKVITSNNSDDGLKNFDGIWSSI